MRAHSISIVAAPINAVGSSRFKGRDIAHRRVWALVVMSTSAAPRRPPHANTRCHAPSGNATQVPGIVEALAHMVGFDGQVIESEFASTRSQEINWQCAHIGAAQHQLGWVPRTPLKESLECMLGLAV
jgi:nucleoside-diphosphate-sugar epimerase